MPYELIALDLDDTLLHTDLGISEANRSALKEAHGNGAKIVLASGRNLVSMEKYSAFLGLTGPDDYIIASNGAQIIATATERVLYERTLPPETCRLAAQALRAVGLPWQIYVNGTIYYSEGNDWIKEDSRLSGMPNEPIGDVESFFTEGQIKFVAPGDADKMPARLAEVARLLSGKAEVLVSKPYFLEVLPLGVDKGEALRVLAETLGIPLERCIACGDAMNDLGMLKTAGLGCAPANATSIVKEAAGYISELTNDQDFVADIVRRFVLPGGPGKVASPKGARLDGGASGRHPGSA